MRASPAARTLILALDVGTSSVRSALFDQRGRRAGASLAQRSISPATDAEGRFELAPAGLLRALRRCIDDTLTWHAAERAGCAITAVGTSCFWHSMLGTDAAGTPLTPVITWADTRAAGAAEALRAELDPVAYHRLTGCMLHASFWPARHRWLAAEAPGMYRRVRYWMSPGEWLQWQLTGVRRCAHGMATGTGLYAPGPMAWDPDLLQRLGIDAHTLAPLDDGPLALDNAAARRWPALRDAPWWPAVGDGITSNLGSGAVKAPYAAINYGTSAAIRVVRSGRDPIAPFGLFAYRVDRRRYLLGGAISNAGSLYAWMRRELRLPESADALERALARRRRRDHGLTVLPFWNGERAPWWRDDLSGCIHGIRQSTTALDVAAALREASFHRLALIAAQIPGMRRRTAIVSGGLSPSALQELADVTGLRLLRAAETQASLRGAAVFAMEAGGRAAPPAPTRGPVVEPDSSMVRRYRASRTRHVALEQDLYRQPA